MIANTLALAAALAVAGCGQHKANDGIASASGAMAHASATPSPQPSQDRQAQALAYARCMRAHGVDMPDPQVDANGGMRMTVQGNGNDATMQAAQEACKHLLPNNGEPPSMSPQMLEQMRKYAACMRQHGVDMPDPAADGKMQIRSGGGPDDPTFKTAQEACKSLAPAGGIVTSGGK